MLGVFVRRQWFVAGEVCDVGAERDPGCAVVHAFFGRGAFDPGRDLCDELAGHDAGVFVVYHREPWPVLAGATATGLSVSLPQPAHAKMTVSQSTTIAPAVVHALSQRMSPPKASPVAPGTCFPK